MKTNPKSPRRNCGFTLVEVLVVIAMIAVLAAGVFALVPKIKRKGDAAKSISDMRQIGTLFAGYAADNSSKLPAPQGSVPNAGGGYEIGLYWHQALAMQIYPEVTKTELTKLSWWKTNKPILHNPQCTASSKPYGWAQWNQGYGMNLMIARNLGNDSGTWTPGGGGANETGVRLAAIDDPARTPIIAPRANFHYTGNELLEKASMEGFLVDGKLPILFVDGHVESMAPQAYVDRNLDQLPRR